MFNKHGKIFEFNIFSSTLGASRLHVFIYSKYKTKIDVQRCLVKTFQYIGGLPEETLNTYTYLYSNALNDITNLIDEMNES